MKKEYFFVIVIIALILSIALFSTGCNKKEESKPLLDDIVSVTNSTTDKTIHDQLDLNISLVKTNGDLATIQESVEIKRQISDTTALIGGKMKTVKVDEMIQSLLSLIDLAYPMDMISAANSYLKGDNNIVFAASVKDGLINLGGEITNNADLAQPCSNIIGGIGEDDFIKFFKDTHIESLSDMTIAKLFTLALTSWAGKTTDTASQEKNSAGGYDYSYNVSDYSMFVQNYIYQFLDTIFIDKVNSSYEDAVALYNSIKDKIFSLITPFSTTLNVNEIDGKINTLTSSGGFSLKLKDKDISDAIEYFGLDSSLVSAIFAILHALDFGTSDGSEDAIEIVVSYSLNESIDYGQVTMDTTASIFDTRDFSKMDEYGVPAILTNAIASYFNAESSEETIAFKEKYGIIKGICHAEDTQQDIKNITDANIEWVRQDIPFPFKKDTSGNITDELRESYINFKKECEKYVDKGLSVIAVTPYPDKYLEYNLDPRNPANEQAIKDIAIFMLRDLKGLVRCIQITNEMDMLTFRAPFTLQEATHFIAINAQAMSTVKEECNMIVGYNSTIGSGNLHKYLLPYLQYMDYVGVDIYFGCFDSFSKELFLYDLITRFVWNLTKKPIIIMEFGYISEGVSKTEAQKAEILQGYGYDSEADARADVVNFVNKWPEDFREWFTNSYPDPDTWAAAIFDAPFFMNEIKHHLYRELGNCRLREYEHTHIGQADFYLDLIPRLKALDFLSGMVIYDYQHSDSCYRCGQADICSQVPPKPTEPGDARVHHRSRFA
ncbi:MAG: hypothetical protein PHR20_09120 [Bacteroidales bacterium]|nr:hypothetical protein [Bacteroidales bacterium]